MVGDDIQITIDLEAVHKPEKAASN